MSTDSRIWTTIASIRPEDFYGSYMKIERKEGGKAFCICPFHNDTDPSLSFYLDSGMWRCFGCGKNGGYIQFLVESGRTEEEAKEEICCKWGKGNYVGKSKPLDEKLPQKLAEKLSAEATHLAFLGECRGLSGESISKYQIGLDPEKKRYSFPIFDYDGKLVNIRYYKPFPQKKIPKWLNTEGYGSEPRIYPFPLLESDEIIMCEGELDAILARQKGFPAYTIINGCKTIPKNLDMFKGKRVYIVYDNDEAGISGGKLLAEALCGKASSIRIIRWPSDMPNKGDVTDFFVKMEKTPEDFRQLLDEAKDWVPPPTANIERNFKAILPDSGFIRTYIDYAAEQTDAPLEFHLAVALGILSSACGNRIDIWEFGQPLLLNLWSILISPSGFYRKSTAIRIGMKQILSRAIPEVVLPEDFSREKLIENLQETPGGLLVLSEFSHFTGSLKADYMSGTTAMLTLLYDSPDEFNRTTKKENVKVIRPAPSILGASTTEWLRTSKEDIAGGFFPRFLFWVGVNKGKSRGIGIEPDPTIQDSLVEFVKGVAQLEGRAVMPPSVKERYNEWQDSHEKEFEIENIKPMFQPFYARLSAYVTKFAVLFQISKDLSLEVTHEALEQAIRTVEYLKANLIKLFTEEISLTKTQSQIKDVKLIIARYKTITKSDLMRETRMLKQELDKIINTLIESGEVVMDNLPTEGRTKQILKINDCDNN